MKKISVVVPCYNEEKTINEMYNRIKKIFTEELKEYCYELIYVDDYSKDSTRDKIRILCMQDTHVKAVFNASNFGFSRNVFSSFQEATGDAVFMVFGDLQDPPELLPEFVKKWESGSGVIIGQKAGSEEGFIMRGMRALYYNIISKLSDSRQIKNYNGYGFYDRSFVDILAQIKDTQPYLKAVIAEYANDYEVISYRQNNSKRGKSNFDFYKNYDFAMEGITSSTKKLMRIATFLGAFLGVFSALFALNVLITKLLNWDTYPIGIASVMVGVFFIGAVQLFFIGILGEYILSINIRTMQRPRVIVQERINMTDCNNQKE